MPCQPYPSDASLLHCSPRLPFAGDAHLGLRVFDYQSYGFWCWNGKPIYFISRWKAEHGDASLWCKFPLCLAWFFIIEQIKAKQGARSKPGMLWQALANNRQNMPIPASARCVWLSLGESSKDSSSRYFNYKCSVKSIHFSVQKQWQTKKGFS